MNIQRNGNNSIKPVVVDFKNYASKKPRFNKVACKGCFYPFEPKNKNVCFCDQCNEGRKVYKNLKDTQSMLTVGGVYGHH